MTDEITTLRGDGWTERSARECGLAVECLDEPAMAFLCRNMLIYMLHCGSVVVQGASGAAEAYEDRASAIDMYPWLEGVL